MKKFKNEKNTPLSVAVWLATDGYDHDDRTNLLSATTIIKPIKQIVLGMRAVAGGTIEPEEIGNLVASRMGTAFHDSIENAWLTNAPQALTDLGYPKRVVDKIRVNPKTSEKDTIPVYLEIRSEKEVGDFIISGKFDMVMEGGVRDFKSTGTYTFTKGVNDYKYILQGSVYRWLNPEIITKDIMHIDFIFTDWMAKLAMGSQRTGYPATRVLSHPLELMSYEATDNYIKAKVEQIVLLTEAPQSEIPDCTKEDLWQSEPVYKYYKNPANAGISGKRSTANFDTIGEAQMRLIKDGSVGKVLEVKGEARACKYCPAANICDQASQLIRAGLLK